MRESLQEKYVAELRRLAKIEDKEIAHADAVDLLRQLLLELGYSEVVAAYEEVDNE